MENNFQFFTLEERYLHFWVYLHNIEYLFRLIFQTWWTYNWKKWLEHWNTFSAKKDHELIICDDLLIIFFSDFPSGIKKLSLKDFPMK